MRLPEVPIPPAWTDAWFLFEADQLYKGCSPRTNKIRLSAVYNLARWMTEQDIYSPADVTRSHLKCYLALQRQLRSGTSIRTLWMSHHVFWSWYAAEYEVPNPMTGIPKPDVTAPKVPVFTPAELRALFAAASGKDFESIRTTAILWVLLETGVCREELVLLDLSDYDRKKRTLTVRPETAKRGRGRVLPVNDQSYAALARWLSRGRPQGSTEAGPLFTHRSGAKISYDSIGDILHRVGEKAKVADVRPHRFRHTNAHLALLGGMDPVDLATQLGHSGLGPEPPRSP